MRDCLRRGHNDAGSDADKRSHLHACRLALALVAASLTRVSKDVSLLQ